MLRARRRRFTIPNSTIRKARKIRPPTTPTTTPRLADAPRPVAGETAVLDGANVGDRGSGAGVVVVSAADGEADGVTAGGNTEVGEVGGERAPSTGAGVGMAVLGWRVGGDVGARVGSATGSTVGLEVGGGVGAVVGRAVGLSAVSQSVAPAAAIGTQHWLNPPAPMKTSGELVQDAAAIELPSK